MKKIVLGVTLAVILFAAMCACGVSILTSQVPGASGLPDQGPTKTTAPGTMGDGQWHVGVDIKPGRYQTSGPLNHRSCYWQVTLTPNADPGSPDFVNNDVPTGRAYVTLKAGQYFQTDGCSTWGLAK